MKRNIIIAAVMILGLSGCDPIHDLKLENQTNKPIVVVYKPLSEVNTSGNKIESFDTNGVTFGKVVLDSGQVLQIGNVTARYAPRPDDVNLDFLEVFIDKDTMKLIGKKAIFSSLQKVNNLDWRLIIRDK